MFKCIWCGEINPKERANFCAVCGPDTAAKSWAESEIDLPHAVKQYVAKITEFYFEDPTETALENYINRFRERWKITHDTHNGIMSRLKSQKAAITHLANFKIEFNENVVDAFAGHDTFLSFRYTNLSDDHRFKVSLYWDDPETVDRIDFRAESKTFVKPGTSVMVGSKAIFDRIGFKEISDLIVTILDDDDQSAKFRVSPFTFKVGNHDQRVTQNISTHNQISIEGRGVVDASGMGADKSSALNVANNQARWVVLDFAYVPEAIEMPEGKQAVVVAEVSALNEHQAKHNEEVAVSNPEFDEDDLFSVLNAAEQGDGSAQHRLGVMYYDGTGVQENHEKSFYWTTKAAEQGISKAQNNLAIFYQLGIGVKIDYEKSIKWYRSAAEQGNADAATNLGEMFQKGEGVAENFEQAAKWYRLAADSGHAVAQRCLGFLYFNGTGLAQDQGQAAQWFRRAAEQGEQYAQTQLGYMYACGEGLEKNYELANKWYTEAAIQGDSSAQSNLAINYEHGLGTQQNLDQALHWFGKAAEQGNAYAQRRVGDFYCQGVAVAQSDKDAAHWYKLSAEQGDAEAQNLLGTLYHSGKGLPQDYGQACHWYRLAADQGDVNAPFNLGILCEFGLGVDKNQDHALAWYRKAGELGHAQAQEKINALDLAKSPPTEGEASWTYTNGTYVGTYKNGLQNGWGEFNWTGEFLGHRYVGNFVNNNRHGVGTYYFPNGTVQEGIFENNTYIGPQQPESPTDGYSACAYEDGSHYQGMFSGGQWNGNGILTMADGSTWEGEWTNGAFNDGFGINGTPDGSRYEGMMVGGTWHGMGTLFLADGTKLEGEFKDGAYVPAKTGFFSKFKEEFSKGYEASRDSYKK